MCDQVGVNQHVSHARYHRVGALYAGKSGDASLFGPD
jgi:hypothetical protein